MIKKLFVIFIILLTLSACDKAFVNGDLDGMWRLERVTCDGMEFCPERIYYSFQRHIVMFGRYYEEGMPFLYMGNFVHESGKITMSGFKEYPGSADICDEGALNSFFIFNVSGEVFDVERLDKDNMVLSTTDRVYYFRKW